MARSLRRFILLAVLGTGNALQASQAPSPQSVVPPPAPLWNLADFDAPESAYYDAPSGALFISSINGDMTAKDGNGYISRLTPDGGIVNRRWVTGLRTRRAFGSTR